MGKVARLMYVSVDDGKTSQSNKYYNMTEQSDGRLVCEWGRVGGGSQVVYKPMYEWDKIYNSKVRKGYTDVTHLRSETVSDSSNLITNTESGKLILKLQGFAKGSIQHNYNISTDAVTPLMVKEAQSVIDELSPLIDRNMRIERLNSLLLTLFKIIPRKMNNVKNFLFSPLVDKEGLENARKIIDREQSILDSMAGQVNLSKEQKDMTSIDDLALSMGLIIEKVTDPNIILSIKTKMNEHHLGNQFKCLYSVTNKKTEENTKKFLPNLKKDHSELLWHGSRNENWFNILQTGLLIRPSGAISVGSMFGLGIYGANQYRKAQNYTSLRGTYWAKGSSNVGFAALFQFLLGEQLHIKHHSSSHYNLNYNQIKRDGYDSVYAHGGADLINDEFVVYNTNQTTIKYLVEVGV